MPRAIGRPRPLRRGLGPVILALTAMILLAFAVTPAAALAARHAGRPTVLHIGCHGECGTWRPCRRDRLSGGGRQAGSRTAGQHPTRRQGQPTSQDGCRRQGVRRDRARPVGRSLQGVGEVRRHVGVPVVDEQDGWLHRHAGATHHRHGPGDARGTPRARRARPSARHGAGRHRGRDDDQGRSGRPEPCAAAGRRERGRSALRGGTTARPSQSAPSASRTR